MHILFFLKKTTFQVILGDWPLIFEVGQADGENLASGGDSLAVKTPGCQKLFTTWTRRLTDN
jgi:hypothetical protein